MSVKNTEIKLEETIENMADDAIFDIKKAKGADYRFLDRPVPSMIARIMVVFVGMALVAFGIAISRQTYLGSSPISAIPMVLSFAFPLSIGTFTFFFNIFLLLLQALVLRKEFSLVQLLQIPFIIIFSATIDGFVMLIETWPFDGYAIRLIWMFISCILVAAGVYLQKQARLIMLPGDALVVAISSVSHKKFSKCKLAFDISQMVIAAVISLICNGALVGVREGTLIAAVLVGPIIGLINKAVGDFQRFLPVDGHPTFMPATVQSD